MDLLKEKELTLSLAESCTGGAIAARIVNVPGASQVFTHGLLLTATVPRENVLE